MCNCGKGSKTRRAPTGWWGVKKSKEKLIFFGERGLVLLRCVDAAGYVGGGTVTNARYEFAEGQVRYVDKRDLPSLPKDRFEKV